MYTWLASSCSSGKADESKSLLIPTDWPQPRPELGILFEFDAACLNLYELFARQQSGSYLHVVSASYLPHSELTDDALKSLLGKLGDKVRRELKDLRANINEIPAENDSETALSVGWDSIVVEVLVSDYLPTISITEFNSDAPNFGLLIENSPLADLAGFSADTWIVNRVACGRTAGSLPHVSIGASDANAELFQKLRELGFEERESVWWKEPVAVRPLSDNSWGAYVPAPSFLPGARK
jgi:hypothetical protein